MSRRDVWTDRHRHATTVGAPSPFVVAALATTAPAAPGARALDVACGRGRHALAAARAGYRVDAVDWAVPALQTLARAARTAELPVHPFAADLVTWRFPRERYALVVVVDYLDRSLVAMLRAALAPGGLFLMETFLAGQERFGHPTNPAYLLKPGELAAACAGWTVLDAYEGIVDHGGHDACRAGVLARAPNAH